jgi:hypothetical protein
MPWSIEDVEKYKKGSSEADKKTGEKLIASDGGH